MIGIQFLSQVIVEDEPEEVRIQLDRMQFIKEKIVDMVADEDFDDKAAEGPSHDEEDGTTGGGCCGGGKSGKIRHRKAQEGLPDLPANFGYPSGSVPGTWPAPLNKDNAIAPAPENDPNAVTAANLDAYAAKFANPVASYN